MSQQHPTSLDAKDVKIQERIVEHPQIHQVEKVGAKDAAAVDASEKSGKLTS